jgi:hypothetical protein
MRAFVWDFADEGIDEVLGRLRESGVDGLHLALAYHGGRFYCPHNPKHCIVDQPEGALYFQPVFTDRDGIRPMLHPQFGSGALVGRVLEAAHEDGMAVAAWLVLFNNPMLSLRYPRLSCVNALGDRLDGALCPANPDVRRYAQALVEDLAHRLGFDIIELEDCAYIPHHATVAPAWRRMPIGNGLGYLLSLCFCEHCRRQAEKANIEIGDLEHHVERMIRSALSGDLSERRIGDEISDPYHPIARYAAVRCEIVSSLLDELSDAASGSPAVLQPILKEEADEIWRWGIALNALRARMMRVTVMTDPSPAVTRPLIERYAEILQMGHELVADVGLGSPQGSDEAPLTAMIEACQRSGVDRFVFSHYGLSPLEMLEGIGGLARR